MANPVLRQHNPCFTLPTSNNVQTLTMTVPTVAGGGSENRTLSYHLGRNTTTSVQPQPLSDPSQVDSVQTSILRQSSRANNALILPQLLPNLNTATPIRSTARSLPTCTGLKENTNVWAKSSSAPSKYVLEIPQLSTPRAISPNGNLSKTTMTPQKSQPLQTTRKSGTSGSAVAPSTPQPRILLPQLQIPLLQTPARPKPSQNVWQPPHRSSRLITFPTLPTQQPNPLQPKSTSSSNATSNGVVSTLEGNISATNGKKTLAEKHSTEPMDMQENVGAIPPSAANQFTASSNQYQPEDADQHNPQQFDPQLQNTHQSSQLDGAYSEVLNADGSTSAEGYMYGEYEGELVSDEFAEGQMMVTSRLCQLYAQTMSYIHVYYS